LPRCCVALNMMGARRDIDGSATGFAEDIENGNMRSCQVISMMQSNFEVGSRQAQEVTC